MHHAIVVGKAILAVSNLTGSQGSTWPGHIALKASPKFIRKAIEKNPGLKVILIAGTNGKTTTTKALSHVLETSGISVMTNKTGANLLNGLASLLIKHINLAGTLRHKALLFEVDENSLPLVLAEIPNPTAIVLLNLFRDQLDRYGEVNTTAEKWKDSLNKLGDATIVVANADDPLVAHVASFSKKQVYFSINSKHKTGRALGHAVDSTTCPKCNNTLEYINITYSHLGCYICENCGYKNPKSYGIEISTSLLGSYNQYNLNAVLLVAKNVFNLKEKEILRNLSSLQPAFGRQEIMPIEGKKIMLLLSKNPTGFNESLKVAIENKSHTVLLLLNDRIPDGRDISWIWDVDFEILKNMKIKVLVSGDRAYDMANRLLFAGIKHLVFKNFESAYKESLKVTEEGKTITILSTYSAMLEIRELISGKKIL